jgi:hypothetical protein
VIPYALVSFDIPFPVVRFNGNYLKTEMLKLFSEFSSEISWKWKKLQDNIAKFA